MQGKHLKMQYVSWIDDSTSFRFFLQGSISLFIVDYKVYPLCELKGHTTYKVLDHSFYLLFWITTTPGWHIGNIKD